MLLAVYDDSKLLQIASKHLVQLKIHLFSGLFFSSFFIPVNESWNPQVSELELFFFSVWIIISNLLGTLVLCPQNDLNLLLTLITGVKMSQKWSQGVLFNLFPYFLNICVDTDCSKSLIMFI